MKVETHNINNAKIAEIIAEGVVLSSTEDALELLGDLCYQGYDKIIIHEKNIAPGFFELSPFASLGLRNHPAFAVQYVYFAEHSIAEGLIALES